MNKKLIKQFAYLLIVIGIISFAVIYCTIDLNSISQLDLFKVEYVLMALLSVTLGFVFDGTRLRSLLSTVGEKITFAETAKVVFSNYFLALLTPGATGAAVAQVMFLKKAGVPVSKATVVVLVRTVMSIGFLIFVLPLALRFDGTVTPWLSKEALEIISLLLVVFFIMLIYLVRTTYPEQLLVFLTRNLNHELKRRIYKFYKEIKITILIFLKNPVTVLRAFIESGASLMFIYLTVPILFYGLDPAINIGNTMCRMIVLNLILYFAPTPGGAGIAEGGFIVLFKPLLPAGTVGIMAIAWRSLVEYLPFAIGAYFSIQTFGADVLNKIYKKERKHDEIGMDEEIEIDERDVH